MWNQNSFSPSKHISSNQYPQIKYFLKLYLKFQSNIQNEFLKNPIKHTKSKQKLVPTLGNETLMQNKQFSDSCILKHKTDKLKSTTLWKTLIK